MSKAITTPKVEEPDTLEKKFTSEEVLEALLKQNEALMTRISQLEQVQVSRITEEQPKNIVNEVFEPLEKPRVIKFKISAYEPDDAVIDGKIVPGKKIVGDFKYLSEVAMDANGAYKTGFELDLIENETGLKGDELTSFQKEVKIAQKYAERLKGSNLSNLNKSFWLNRNLVVDNLDMTYETSLIDSLIMYYSIMGGAYPEIAKSREDAIRSQKLLYLDVAAQEVKSKASLMVSKIEASAALKDIRDNWKMKDVLYLIYALGTSRKHGFTLDTPRDILINELDEYIVGRDTVTEKKKRPARFLEAVEKMKSPAEGERIRTEGLVRAGEYYGFIHYSNKDKIFTHRESGSILGTTVKAAVDYLTNPVNAEDFASLSAAVTKKWTD